MNASSNYERQLQLLIDGRITFDAFARETRADYERMARYLVRRWTPPAWYVPEDVVQELLVGTWLRVWDYDPGGNRVMPLGLAGESASRQAKSPSLARFAVYNAISHAKRQLHKARGAKLCGTPDKNPSRIERPVSSLGGDDGEREAWVEALLAVPAEAETALVEREERDAALDNALAACETETERSVIRALFAADGLEEGARAIYDDPGNRWDLGIWSEDEAVTLVVRTAAEVATRIEEEEDQRAAS